MVKTETRRAIALERLMERAEACNGHGWCTISYDVLRDAIAALAREEEDHKLLEKARAGRVLKWRGGGVVVFNADWYDRHRRREAVREDRDE